MRLPALVCWIALACMLAASSHVVAQAPAEAPPAPAAPEVLALADQVDSERLMQTIRDLPTARSGWGDEAHWQGLLDAEKLVIARFEAMGLTPQTQEIPWPARRRRVVSPDREQGVTPEDVQARPRFRNIWVDLPPTPHDEQGAEAASAEPGADARAQVILFSAHLDAVRGAPGADDDGTGVAAILEMARLLKDQPRRRTLRLMLFNIEEAGLIGSRYYVAEGLDRQRERIVGMASLDMLGYFTDEPGSQQSPIRAIEGVFEPPTAGDFIAMGGILRHREFSQRLALLMQAGAPELKVLVADFLPFAPPDMLRSDHAPFLAIGAPAVIISDTANFRSEHYHTPTDTIETLDAERFTLVVRGLVVAAAQMSRDEALADASVEAPAP